MQSPKKEPASPPSHQIRQKTRADNPPQNRLSPPQPGAESEAGSGRHEGSRHETERKGSPPSIARQPFSDTTTESYASDTLQQQRLGFSRENMPRQSHVSAQGGDVGGRNRFSAQVNGVNGAANTQGTEENSDLCMSSEMGCGDIQNTLSESFMRDVRKIGGPDMLSTHFPPVPGIPACGQGNHAENASPSAARQTTHQSTDDSSPPGAAGGNNITVNYNLTVENGTHVYVKNMRADTSHFGPQVTNNSTHPGENNHHPELCALPSNENGMLEPQAEGLPTGETDLRGQTAMRELPFTPQNGEYLSDSNSLVCCPTE
ncbi:hypothetical protein BaRGS_00034780 [Batillaria attramentaria]|uniref:Uncharacterized protein n=1 Tax=Batillaria attramentaria TaxID=370345 RepID=A0ABD0JG94_9CAEN